MSGGERFVGIAYHGSSSRWADAFVEDGLDPAPGHTPYDGHNVPYGGTYFTTHFGAALERALNACDKFGGNPIVAICSIDAKIHADEDAAFKFLYEMMFAGEEDIDMDRYRDDPGHRPEVDDLIGRRFRYFFGKEAPASLYDLVHAIWVRGGDFHDAEYRRLTDVFTRELGIAMSTYHPDAEDFRTFERTPPSRIEAIVEVTHDLTEWRTRNQGELPEDLEFRVVFGEIPPGATIRQDASVDWDRFLAVGMP